MLQEVLEGLEVLVEMGGQLVEKVPYQSSYLTQITHPTHPSQPSLSHFNPLKEEQEGEMMDLAVMDLAERGLQEREVQEEKEQEEKGQEKKVQGG